MAKIHSQSGVPAAVVADRAIPVSGTWEASSMEGLGAAVYVGSGGDLTVKLVGDPNNAVTFKNVPSGSFLPLNIVAVLPSSASDILVLI